MPFEDRSPDEISGAEGIPKGQYDVVAHPVDTLVQPEQHTELEQLAGALGRFSPKLEQFGEALQAKRKAYGTQQGTAEGQAAFLKDQANYKQAVENGDIPAAGNPYARQAAKETFGRLAAGHYVDWLISQPDVANVMQNSTDPTAFQKLEQTKRQDYMKQNFGDTHSDLAFMNSFQSLAGGYVQEQAHTYAQRVNERFMGQSVKNTAADLSSFVSEQLDTHQEGHSITEGLDALVNGPHGAIATGLPNMLVPSVIATALDGLARERGDASVYDLAKGIKYTGTDGKQHDLYDSPDFLEKLNKGRVEIVRTEHTELTVEAQERREKQNDARAAVSGDLVTAQLASGKAVDLQPYIKRLQDAGLGDKVNELNQVQAAVMKQGSSDPETIRSLTAHIFSTNDSNDISYVGKTTLVSALAKGEINTHDFNDLMNEVSKRDAKKKGRNGKDTTPTDDFDKIEARWYGLLNKDYHADIPTIQPEWNAAHEKAVTELGYAMRLYKTAHHGDLDPEKYEKFIYNEVSRINKLYGIDANAGEPRQHVKHGEKEIKTDLQNYLQQEKADEEAASSK